MPKTDIDYSNTIIYKITCKDPTIKDVYVGHTTNFVQRKHAHKQSCINANALNYKCKLYETIRKTGGWNNWHMEIVSFFNCRDNYEARAKEQEYFVLLNATLNSIEPLPKAKKLILDNDLEQKQKRMTKKTNPLICEKCNFKCFKNIEWKRHISTSKHNRPILNDLAQKSQINMKEYICNRCSKEYTARNSLWYHEKKCTYEKPIEDIRTVDEKPDTHLIDIIQILIKENQDMRNAMIKENQDMRNALMDIVKCQQPKPN